MHRSAHHLRLILAALGIMAGAQALAQTAATAETGSCSRTRAEVKAECLEFLRTHQWDETAGDYVLKPGMKGQAKAKPPEGVKTRAEVRAERDRFLKANRWDDLASSWVPIAGAPRDLSTLTRADLRKETQAFMRTHRWDDVLGEYVETKPKAK